MDNKEIAASFKLLASLMELHGENEFRIRSYRNAYNALRKVEQPLSGMSSDEIQSISGIGKSTAEKIDELIQTGGMERLKKYQDKTPPGIVELLEIRGIGPSKVRTMWKELNITSPGELLYACNENRLIEAHGFGLKTQKDMREKAEYYLASRNKWLYARIEPYVQRISSQLQAAGANHISPVGEYARKNTVIQHLEIAQQGLPPSQIAGLDSFEDVGDGFYVFEDSVRFYLHYIPDDEPWMGKYFPLTCTSEVLSIIDIDETAETEAGIFASAGVSFVIPEMRDREDAFDAALEKERYIDTADIRGILHNHSTYSDGLHTVREMAEYVRDAGYEYFGISDHSKTAVYANGLSVEEVHRQQAEIDELNAEMTPFKTFKGIESDILADGSLDYEDDVLDSFDFVVASVHSGLKMDETKATKRLIKAISNPYTSILGHPTGRLLLTRKGYPIDYKAVIDACAEYRVAIELNANPLRLDLDHSWIPYALERGVYIAINPDAHSRESIRNVRYGVYAARKGGLTTDMCLNAMSLENFADWLQSRK